MFITDFARERLKESCPPSIVSSRPKNPATRFWPSGPRLMSQVVSHPWVMRPPTVASSPTITTLSPASAAVTAALMASGPAP